MKLCIVLLVLCCVAVQWSEAGRWRRRIWHRPIKYPRLRILFGNGWIRRKLPGVVGKMSPPVRGRDVDAEVDQSDDEDFDEAELEKLFNERDVMDLVEELDDDDDDSFSVDEVNDKQ